LISRLSAALRGRTQLDANDSAKLARAIEERLSEVKAEAALYDALPGGANKFQRLVRSVQKEIRGP
jgi:hypothetical protein